MKQTITTAQQIETYIAALTNCITLATKSAISQSNGSLKKFKNINRDQKPILRVYTESVNVDLGIVYKKIIF
jgi:hypothetical protein